ncbi:hydroxylamine reductase, partial [Candidatus Bathyarchaeota archaeon]|nr:hydroxylamine reductase [Candidatus Bathyarchaeota archaeon]
MFCYQCEQTAEGKGCTKYGVCGKSPEVSALQDLLVYAVKGLSLYALEGRKVKVNDADINRFVSKAMFATLTNVNFDPQRIKSLIEDTVRHRETLRKKIRAAGGKADISEGPATFTPENTIEGLIKQGEKSGIWIDPNLNPDVNSLISTLIYGIKGIAAYADHAAILGKEDDTIYQF